MRIIFVLPKAFYDTPIGGYKIIFNYANALAKKNNNVYIYFLSDAFPPVNKFSLRQLCRFIYHKFFKNRNKKITWFDIDPQVHLVFEKSILEFTFHSGDVIFATAASTAKLVNKLSPRHGKHFYFIQHDESTFEPDYDTWNTWKLNMKKIVVATWIKHRIEKRTQSCVALVPNFINRQNFGIDNDITHRHAVISMLYNTQSIKGTKYGMEALAIIKKLYPSVQVILFGVTSGPTHAMFNFKYFQKVNDKQLRRIYNESSIYVLPSILEGWGLTATDAMECGAALVTTDNGGVDDFTQNNISAIKVPVKSSLELAQGIEKLLINDDLRIKIAKEGVASIQKFTFERSFNELESIIKQEIGSI
ncbi:hypothetical protein AO499_08720 [Oenococcus oeni]|uniref:glycosyltransferase family 4 protein n=2 Tax=Oenococcus oeni TaxID=1247 RepID=UPI00050DC714|nr:glycosyltransferase family 4 protein [Oenococcus oeni]KGH57477.1 hypothetical protein X289_04795 [Oenococcus oeni IOEB_B10]PDH77547.1 hypothetical protein AO499_08720 [Oenococcus oeni]